jgi:hypothetical protein
MITAVLCIVAAILSFNLSREFSIRSESRSRSAAKRTTTATVLGSGALLLGLLCALLYIDAFGRFVFVKEQRVGNEIRKVRKVIGTELQSDLQGSKDSPEQLLMDNEYDPEKVWTRDSLSRTQFRVFLLFVGTFLLFTFGPGLLTPLAGGRSANPQTTKVKAQSKNVAP